MAWNWIGLVAALVFVGCAAQGTSFQPAQSAGGNATVYVYRPYSVLGSGLRPTVFCNDSSVQIGPGGYHAFEASPGPVRCHVETVNSAEIEINAAAGGVYYVKEQLGWGMVVGIPHLYPMDTPADLDKARAEIQACSL
jgi:hypothetical protein